MVQKTVHIVQFKNISTKHNKLLLVVLLYGHAPPLKKSRKSYQSVT